jgi:phosphate transport system substrate-binding protein
MRLKRNGIFILIGLLFVLSNCTSLNQSPGESLPTPPTTASPNLASLTNESEQTLSWVGCGISRKAFMDELAAAYTAKTGVQINIEGGGATRGIRDTAALQADMGGSCRHTLPQDEESNATLIPVGWDALVAIVHPDNPVDGITLEQLKSVLTGEIKNWDDLGGPDHAINLIIRDQGAGGKESGVGLMTRELIFFDRTISYTDDATVVASTGPLEEIIETDPWAFGVTGISSARRRDVKIVMLDGFSPTYENIVTGIYPLFRPLYLVLPKETPNDSEPAQNFIAFALSDEGQSILKQNGTVTLEDGAGLWPKYREKMLQAGVEMGDY